jgi:hypothetical protein
MATHRAVEAVCQTIVELLRDNYDPTAFSQQLEFRVVSSSGLVNGSVDAGVTLFLDGTDRSPGGRATIDGQRFRPDPPLDLHFVLTVWGSDPSLQHSIAGWMMRTLEDHGSLPSGLLNRRTDGVFRPDEAVEVGVADLDNEELFRLWELIGPNAYQLSIPYYARGVRIASQIPLEEYLRVQQRRFHHGTAGPGDMLTEAGLGALRLHRVFSPLGVQFRDPLNDAPVLDGLVVTAFRDRPRGKVSQATPSPSGVWSFRGLDGLAAVELPDSDEALEAGAGRTGAFPGRGGRPPQPLPDHGARGTRATRRPPDPRRAVHRRVGEGWPRLPILGALATAAARHRGDQGPPRRGRRHADGPRSGDGGRGRPPLGRDVGPGRAPCWSRCPTHGSPVR